MPRYAIVRDGVVVNTAVAASALEAGWIASETASIGQTYDGEAFADPPAPVPVSVSARQARLAMEAAGLLDDVEAALSGMPTAAQIEFDFATEVRRDHPLVAALAAALSLSEAAVDDLFRAAAAL